MEPSLELDALVAEKVMGWKRIEPDGRYFHGGWSAGYAISKAEEHSIRSCAAPLRMLPTYSSDIAAAWEIVRKFLEQLRWNVELSSDQGELLEWRCELRGGDPYVEVYADAPTAPEAICLAALDAVGYKFPEGGG